MNYYEILGVDEDATQEEIESAYRHKVKHTHPDQSDHPNAAQLFKRLQQAYDVLGDPESRDEYDSNDGEAGSTKETIGDWRSNVRGLDLAEPIWTVDYSRSVYPTDSGERESSRKVVIGQLVMAMFGGFVGVVISVGVLTAVLDVPPGLSPMQIVLPIVGYFITLLIVEKLTGTKRKITDIINI